MRCCGALVLVVAYSLAKIAGTWMAGVNDVVGVGVVGVAAATGRRLQQPSPSHARTSFSSNTCYLNRGLTTVATHSSLSTHSSSSWHFFGKAYTRSTFWEPNRLKFKSKPRFLLPKSTKIDRSFYSPILLAIICSRFTN